MKYFTELKFHKILYPYCHSSLLPAQAAVMSEGIRKFKFMQIGYSQKCCLLHAQYFSKNIFNLIFNLYKIKQ